MRSQEERKDRASIGCRLARLPALENALDKSGSSEVAGLLDLFCKLDVLSFIPLRDHRSMQPEYRHSQEEGDQRDGRD